jgi:thiazole/oxazole-forming peptide maturase SagD family component
MTHVDITSDLTIPVVLALLEDEREKNFFMVTMATAPTSEALLEKLYKELFHFCYPLLMHGDEYRTKVTRAKDPFRVVTMADHVCFYQNRRKIRYTSFLTSSTDEKPFGTLPLPCGEPRAAEHELRHLVERLHQRGYDVIVVDCSAPLLRQVGLHVVKVLVPGLQPLHAGHRYRVLGGRRLFEVARLMGYADRDRTLEDLNPWPHPYW